MQDVMFLMSGEVYFTYGDVTCGFGQIVACPTTSEPEQAAQHYRREVAIAISAKQVPPSEGGKSHAWLTPSGWGQIRTLSFVESNHMESLREVYPGKHGKEKQNAPASISPIARCIVEVEGTIELKGFRTLQWFGWQAIRCRHLLQLALFHSA